MLGTTDHEWTTVLDVPEDSGVNWLVLLNQGDSPGFWRFLGPDGDATPPARLPVNSSTSFPLPDGCVAKLQVKRGIADGHLHGLFAWGCQIEQTYEDDDETDNE